MQRCCCAKRSRRSGGVIVDRINTELNKVIQDPEFVQRIATDGLVPAGGSPERLLKLLVEEMANRARVIERVVLTAQQ